MKRNSLFEKVRTIFIRAAISRSEEGILPRYSHELLSLSLVAKKGYSHVTPMIDAYDALGDIEQ